MCDYKRGIDRQNEYTPLCNTVFYYSVGYIVLSIAGNENAHR